jgi:hypothetical protein
MAKGIDLNSDTTTARWGKGALERTLSAQRPAVLAHLKSVRKLHPNASTEEVLRILENRYLAAVTAGGAATGGAAAIPGIGTGASLLLSGAETVGFLEASALFAQSVAELHGIAVVDPERASSLVMALMLGGAGSELVQQFAGEAAGTGPARSAFWGELVTNRMPKTVINRLTKRIRTMFLRRFAARQGASIVLRAVPFGVGAVIGGTGNHLLGRRVIEASREAFGPPPPTFPGEVLLESHESEESTAPVEDDPSI